MVFMSETRYRSLVELQTKPSEGFPRGNISAVAGALEDEGKIYVAVRRRENDADATHVFRVLVHSNRYYSINEASGRFPTEEQIQQMVYAGGTLWARTQAGRLFENRGAEWH